MLYYALKKFEPKMFPIPCPVSNSFQIVWESGDANCEPQDNDTIFIISVDGTHCRINEPRKNPSSQWYSHKFHKPGVTYELGIDIRSSKLVWINGPFPAGQNDLQVFRKEGGLKSQIPDGKKAIADSGYAGEPKLSIQNPHDTSLVKNYKNRARARHESFNGRIKSFKILDERFRHGFAKHKAVFEAVCVIVQFDLENGHPLFGI